VLHLRLVVPAECSNAVVDFLIADERVTGVVVLPGAARDPHGDAVLCDVARESASDVLSQLRRLGLDDRGTVAIEEVAASPSRRARGAEAAAPGSPDDAVVWEVVTDRAYADARPSWSFYAFLALATTIAGIAVILDSSVLVVGAMVVGPEFGAVAAVATGLALRERRLVTGGLRLLLLAFAFAMAVTALLALAARGAGWVDPSALTAPRPLTGFV
jgi:hypothetical protein